MSDKWKAGPEVQDQINHLIGNAHPHLADIMDDIVVIFKEKCSRKGGRPILGKTSKAPAILSVLGEHTYEFVIELGADCWNNLNEAQRMALLDHLLCFIGGEEDEKSGEMKYYLSTPDVFYFSEEVERNGSWREDMMPDGVPEEEGSDAPLLDPIG
jgi:hypothetical protein